MAAFYGIVALALFASNLAGEFNKGTLRMLFVTEPHRLKVLAGKLLALSSFVAAAIAATLASASALALMASRVGVETAAWWTTDGLAAIGAAYITSRLLPSSLHSSGPQSRCSPDPRSYAAV
jgi:ABC-2 type transport system permease protein